jgi:hypothetical protein
MKKYIEPIYKGFNKKCYSEPPERRSESEDCECEPRTIYHNSNVDVTGPTAETKVSSTKTNDMQRRYIESTPFSVDRTICLPLETDPKVVIEEAHHFIVYRRSYANSSIRRKFQKILKQRRL